MKPKGTFQLLARELGTPRLFTHDFAIVSQSGRIKQARYENKQKNIND